MELEEFACSLFCVLTFMFFVYIFFFSSVFFALYLHRCLSAERVTLVLCALYIWLDGLDFQHSVIDGGVCVK